MLCVECTSHKKKSSKKGEDNSEDGETESEEEKRALLGEVEDQDVIKS